MGGKMVSACLRAAFFAVFCVVACIPAKAQQSSGPVTQDGGDYKPPAHMIAKYPDLQVAHQATQPQGGSNLKTVGLILGIGDTFTVKTVGITAFGNEENHFPIAAWKVNDRVAATVQNLLKKNFRVKRIPATESAFASLYKPGGLFRDHEEEYLTIVRKLATSQQADYYLVISRAGSSFGSSNQFLSGLGVTRTDGGILGNGADYVHALTLMRVYDPQFKMLREQQGTIGQDSFLATVKGPHAELSDEAKRLPKEPQAAVNDPRARQLTLELLDKSLAMTVPKLFAAD